MSRVTGDDFLRLKEAAEFVEREVSREHHSHPLLQKALQHLEAELKRYQSRRKAIEVCGGSIKAFQSNESQDLVRECGVLIECVTLLLHS